MDIDFETLRRLGITLEVDSEGFWHLPDLVDENDE